MDAFSKFVRLFATKTTYSKEVIVFNYFFQSYNKPKTIISDQGSSFTSQEFEKFIKEQDIKRIQIATAQHTFFTSK